MGWRIYIQMLTMSFLSTVNHVSAQPRNEVPALDSTSLSKLSKDIYHMCICTYLGPGWGTSSVNSRFKILIKLIQMKPYSFLSFYFTPLLVASDLITFALLLIYSEQVYSHTKRWSLFGLVWTDPDRSELRNVQMRDPGVQWEVC